MPIPRRRKLRELERSCLDRLLAASPPLARLRDLATRFAAMVRGRSGDAFEAWQADAAGSELQSFANCSSSTSSAAVLAFIGETCSN
jgi:hypothetical protein